MIRRFRALVVGAAGLSLLVLLDLAPAAQQRPPAEPPPPQRPPVEPPAVVPEKLKSFVPITEDMLLRPRPENWISFRNGYSM